ncbi:hypothetical protein [Pedobacter ureilyticus]|uniref:Uncharacterized protein n=1 Tax=Pedobacter ureilyticus TaxID=1393051 RepID=A0ABW9J5E7_9SPHI|nr:hypothetical protein [Pedobacter helvus]
MKLEPDVISLMQSPTQYCSALKLNSELDSWLSVSPTLAHIERKGAKLCIALMVKLINDLANSLNVGKNMTAQQVIDASQILFDEFGQMKLNDVVLCFNKIKRGHYGVIYDRLDVHVIMEKMHRFQADQYEQIEHYRQKENNELKRLDKETPMLSETNAADNPTALKHIRAIQNTVSKASSLKSPKINRIGVIQDRFAKYYAIFHQHAERYWSKDGGIPGGKVFIKRYGAMLDVTEFVKHKAYQLGLARERFPDIWT